VTVPEHVDALARLTVEAGITLRDDVDAGRVGRDQVAIPEAMEVVSRQRMRWTVLMRESWAL
jgi:hypothetical protein